MLGGGVSLVQAQASATPTPTPTPAAQPTAPAPKGVTLPTINCPAGVPGCSTAATTSLTTDGAASSTTQVILTILDGVLKFAALIAVLMLIIAGGRLVVARGNQEDIQAAHKQIVWTLAGLFVIIASLLIVDNVVKLVFDATVSQ